MIDIFPEYDLNACGMVGRLNFYFQPINHRGGAMKRSVLCILLITIALAVVLTPAWAAPRKGGTFVFCAPYGGDIFSLDMHRTARTQDYIVGLNINRSLYKWNAATNHPVLDLATSVDISTDGLVYTFHLRKNVKFHNGRTMTADDIIWSYNRIMTPKTASSAVNDIRNIQGAQDVLDGKATSISGLKKIDDYTLQITLAKPVNLSFPLSLIETAILPKEVVEAEGDAFGLHPVGCGPFKFVSWTKGSQVVLERFDGFYEKGKPYLDKLVYKIMPEDAARDLAFRAKEIDASIVGSAQYPVYKKDPIFKKNMVEVAEMFTRLMGMNPHFKPFSDKRVRQAINYAINSPLIIRTLLKGKAYDAKGFLPVSSPAYDPKGFGYTYNVAKAKALMKEAGYEKGFTFECIGTGNSSWGIPVVEALIPFLKKINVTVKPQQLEGAALTERIRRGNFEAFIWSITSGPDPWEALQRFYSKVPVSSGNYAMFANPEYDALIDKAAVQRDPVKRIAVLKQANALLTEQAPVWFFNYNKAIIVHQPWVHGIQPVAIEMMFQDFTNMWIDKTSPRATAK
jgi:peptide/nickel transport system substrate-binding protein